MPFSLLRLANREGIIVDPTPFVTKRSCLFMNALKHHLRQLLLFSE